MSPFNRSYSCQSVIVRIALFCTIFELFDVEEYRDLEIQVRGSLILSIYARSVQH